MGFLKPKAATSTSENTNNALLTSTYKPSMQQGVGATNFLSSLLTGQGDVGAAQGGFDTYLQNAGYENALRNMSRSVVGGGAASGLLRSGATSNALLKGGAEINQGMFNNYLQQLQGLSGIGLQSGGLVANAGQRSTSQGGGPSTAGVIGSLIGGIGSIFCDRRLKEDVTYVGEMPDGLRLYLFRYIGGVKKFLGPMADEVAILRPWALGPTVAGYATVNMKAL